MRKASMMLSSSSNTADKMEKKRVVVIGNDMVGQRFMEKLVQHDQNKQCLLTTICEEPRAAYNRVRLTSYFETRDPSAHSMMSEFNKDGRTAWYQENGVEILIGDKAVAIDTATKTVTGASGKTIPYDVCVLATGSSPFVTPIPGRQRPGVFVHRTIEDLETMLQCAQKNNVKLAAVIGGGLLGLEAPKAVKDMGVTSHIIEFTPILMCRQIDQGGHDALVGKIEELGLHVHCNARTEFIVGTNGTVDNKSTAPVLALRFSNGWDDLPVQMVVVGCGTKPRDKLACAAQITIGERGGVVVDKQMRTSADGVYAIGEIALNKNFIYGLIAPGYTMAEVAAKCVANDAGLSQNVEEKPAFTGADLFTKLKLLGCNVASFGVNQPKPDDKDVSNLVWNNPISGVYRKLIFNKAGTKLRGGILVGDAGDYTTLHKLAIGTDQVLTESPDLLLPPPLARGGAAEVNTEKVSSDPNVQICSCNDVTRETIAQAVKDLGVDGATLPALKKCTKAGTGCGGCEPQVKAILAEELEKLGGKVSNSLCKHFEMSCPELVALIQTDPDPSSVECGYV